MAGRARVLVVEDEWFLAEEYARILRASGYDVAGPAPSAEVATQLIERQPIDAALLDIRLSAGDCYDVAEELEKRGIPFAFVSGYSSREIPSHLGHHPLLSKPAAAPMILATLCMLLDTPP